MKGIKDGMAIKKIRFLIVALLIMSLFVVGCSNKTELREKMDSANLKEFSFEKSKKYDCMELSFENKIYRPFCEEEPKNLSEENMIGYYTDDSGNKAYIFLLDGNVSDNWLITAYIDKSGKIDNCNSYSVWKEIKEKDIPKGIKMESDYKEWN